MKIRFFIQHILLLFLGIFPPRKSIPNQYLSIPKNINIFSSLIETLTNKYKRSKTNLSSMRSHTISPPRYLIRALIRKHDHQPPSINPDDLLFPLYIYPYITTPSRRLATRTARLYLAKPFPRSSRETQLYFPPSLVFINPRAFSDAHAREIIKHARVSVFPADGVR